jgi:hypothetical protein
MRQDTFVEKNRAELERLRGLFERVSDGELRRPVKESWTVAGVLGHIAFWDGRPLFLARAANAGHLDPAAGTDRGVLSSLARWRAT